MLTGSSYTVPLSLPFLGTVPYVGILTVNDFRLHPCFISLKMSSFPGLIC